MNAQEQAYINGFVKRAAYKKAAVHIDPAVPGAYVHWGT
jgi:hypothetical protein